MELMTPKILVYGNPVDGFRFVGPFPSFGDAVVYRDSEPDIDNIWVAELDAPAEEED